MNLLLRIFIIGMWVTLGVPLLLIGVVFAWKMFTGTDTLEFTSPSGERRLSLTKDCRFVGCIGNGELDYVIDGSSASMQCGPFPDAFSEWLFAGDREAVWEAGETKVSFRRPAPGDSGAVAGDRTIDLVQDCRHKVSYTWRNPGPVGFRFQENCLAATCRRSMTLVYPGPDYLFIPCRADAPGRRLVFSTGDDHDPNMEVDLDEQARRATWTSLSTGISGVIELEADCDRGKQWREPAPP